MKKIKKILTILIIVLTFNFSYVNAESFDITSKNVILYNLNDDSVLYEKNSNEKVQIASLTKIMTAIVAIENIDNLDEILDKIINKKYNIEEVQKEYGLSINDLNIVKLSLAKEYYKKALYINGDKFVKEVEKQKDKSKEVKRFIDEIKKNKLFYKNRT